MHPQRNPDVKTTLLPDGYVVLFNQKTDWAHTLSPTGALVWEYCDGGHTGAEIVRELAEVMDQPPDKDQVEQLIVELLESGLLLG